MKKRVKPEELSVTYRELGSHALRTLWWSLNIPRRRESGWTPPSEVMGASGSVRYYMPRIEVEISDIEPSIEVEDVEEADHGSAINSKVSLTKRPFTGTRRVYFLLEEGQAVTLIKVTHIKIGWVSCGIIRKTMANQCYRCLGFALMAADCWGPDRSRKKKISPDITIFR